MFQVAVACLACHLHARLRSFHDSTRRNLALFGEEAKRLPYGDTMVGRTKCCFVVVNPVSGKGEAPEFVEKNVRPLLEAEGIEHEIRRTEGDRGGIALGKQLFTASHQRPNGERTTLIVAGGDGTAHELIEGVLTAAWEENTPAGEWDLVILPLGTANALFWSVFPDPQVLVMGTPPAVTQSLLQSEYTTTELHALSSLLLYLKHSTIPRRLPITLTRLLDRSGQPTTSQPIPSHIVLSTSLHAAILKSSEALREQYPGTERFRMAAQQNAGVFYSANVRLSGHVQQYNPSTRSFAAAYTGDSPAEGGDGLDLDGPFAYFLSSTTAPRLEPHFVISPTLQRILPDGKTMDITVLRPMRDPRVKAAIDRKGEKSPSEVWTARAWEVLGKAYEDGAHIDLVYDGDGNAKPYKASEGAFKPDAVVVETFRCSGFQWRPSKDETDAASRLVCADGSLHEIPRSGSVAVSVMSDDGSHGFKVYA